MIITHAFRLKPAQDLKKEIIAFVQEKQINAGWIGCCVGSLTDYHLRFANQQQGIKGKGHFEITSLTGTVSVNGVHLHLSLADKEGNTRGGHLLDDNLIYTTAEIIILQETSLVFTREPDEKTGWSELTIRNKSTVQ